MAKFNVSPEPRDPGGFRVGEGQPAFDFGSVIKGLGTLFETAVVEKDNSNINAITNQVSAANQEASSSLFSSDASSPSDTQPSAPAEGTGLIGSGSSTPKTEPLPTEIGGLQSELTRLKAARDQNKLSHSAYLRRLETATKSIRAMFPGYGDKIDDIVKATTGIIPANELFKLREKELEAAEKEFNLQRKQGLDTFNEGLKKGLWNEKELEILRQNTSDQNVQAYMTRVLAANYKVEADREAVAAKKSDASEAAIRAARFQADLFLGRISTATGNPTWKQLQEKMNQFAGMNPQQKATSGPELLMQLNMAKAQAKQKIIAELSKPDSNGNSYISLINDKSKIDSIIDQSMLEINTMADAITNSEHGLASMVKAYIDARENGWKLEQGPGTTFQKLKAVGVPPEVISVAMQSRGTSWLNKMIDEADVAMATQGIGLVLTEPNKPMASVITDTNKQKQNPEISNAILSQPLDFIKNPKITAPMASVAIDNVYGSGNLAIIDTAKTPEQKKFLYSKLTSPEMTSRMIELGKQDPAILDKYEKFVMSTSRSVLAEDMSTLRQTVVDKGAGWDVKYENGKFSLVQNDIGRKQVLPVPDPTGSANQPDPVLQNAVNNINNVLGVLQPVWQAKGGNPEEMTQKFFGVMNISPDTPKRPTLFESITRAITGDNDPTKVMDDMKTLEKELEQAKKRVELGRPFAKSDVSRIESEIKKKQELIGELTAGDTQPNEPRQFPKTSNSDTQPTEPNQAPGELDTVVQPNEPRQFPKTSGTVKEKPDLPKFEQAPITNQSTPSETPVVQPTAASPTSTVDPRQFAGKGPGGTFDMEGFRNARVAAGEDPNTRANLSRPAPPVVASGSIEAGQRVPYESGGARSRGASRRATFSGSVTSAINQAASAAGMNPNVLMAFADIESGGRPNVTTGSYKGLFQLSEKEFRKYGGKGDIYDPVENARVAAIKLKAESAQFEKRYGRPATPFDLYMVHQQGWDGYGKHLENPKGLAWENMFRTGEGRQKGKKWSKMAIWGNIPTSARSKYFGMPKGAGKGLYSGIEYVDNVTSEDFLNVWRNRVGRGLGSK